LQDSLVAEGLVATQVRPHPGQQALGRDALSTMVIGIGLQVSYLIRFRSVAEHGDHGRLISGLDLLIDEVDWKVLFLHARRGGFLGFEERHFLIPIEAVSYVGGGFVKTELS
jgi:hypothetical protein